MFALINMVIIIFLFLITFVTSFLLYMIVNHLVKPHRKFFGLESVKTDANR